MRLTYFAAGLLLVGETLASSCGPAPAAVRDIQANRYYTDAAGSLIDPGLRAKNDAAVKPLRDFRRALGRQPVPCALEWLAAWAEADALLGHMSSSQAEYERKWTLAALAVAYLDLKGQVDSKQRQAINPWLLRVANEVQRFADAPGRTKNNHYYWAGLAVGAVGAATESPPHWEFARRVFRDGCADIRPDGTLPLELARQGRALHYHRFALEPLAKLAEIAAARGEDWLATSGGCLERLEALTRRGL